ncbi:MAG: hypothetical protein R3284_11310 [Rubricoccaceae bacterium]|nr:hypothetical protein [Rubricoccaceae bacterium]
MNTPVYSIAVPEYTISAEPDSAVIGAKLDAFIERHFPGRRLALRGVFLGDHPAVSREELTARILELGTDRYDPDRKGIHHETYDPAGVEIHAVACEVTDRLRGLLNDDYIAAPSVMAEFISDFYHSAKAERGYPLHLDLLLVYDLDCLKPAPAGSTQSFAFKEPDQKQEALIGVINILE